MTTRDKITGTAFDVWQDMHSADFDILMAYKHGSPDAFMAARKKLAACVGKIDATITMIATELRVREMNAELPDDVREVMQLKGMI